MSPKMLLNQLYRYKYNNLCQALHKIIAITVHLNLFLRQKRGIMKATIYKGFTYVHCFFVVAGIGVEER
jgi:hypothetical protein